MSGNSIGLGEEIKKKDQKCSVCMLIWSAVSHTLQQVGSGQVNEQTDGQRHTLVGHNKQTDF